MLLYTVTHLSSMLRSLACLNPITVTLYSLFDIGILFDSVIVVYIFNQFLIKLPNLIPKYGFQLIMQVFITSMQTGQH